MRPIHLTAVALALALAAPARAADSLQAAYALQHQHRWQEAEQAFRQALAAKPDAAHYAALADFLDLTGRPADGLAVAEKGLSAFPQDAPLAAADAECLGDVGHYHASMALCNRELARSRHTTTPKATLARFRLILAGDQGDAAQKDGIFAMFKYAFSVKANIDKARTLDPTYARAVYGAGMYEAESPIGGNLTEGIALLEKAHRLDPDDYGIDLDLISQLAHAGHKSEARKELAAFEEAFSGLPAARHDIRPLEKKLGTGD